MIIINSAADAYRAAILREAANALASLGPEDSLVSGPKAWNEAIETLRRMADEAAADSAGPTCSQCPTPVQPGVTYCSTACRNLDDRHDNTAGDHA